MDNNEPKEEQSTITMRQNLSDKDIKQAAVLTLADNGFSHGAIATAVNYHTKSVGRVLPGLKKKSLTHPRMIALAHKTVEKCMTGFIGERQPIKDETGTIVLKSNGKAETEIVTDGRVKASDAMRAAETVYSRAEPKNEPGLGATTQLFFQINQTYFDAPPAKLAAIDPAKVIKE